MHDLGARFLDAPFTGTKGAATKGELVYYIGGDEETFRRKTGPGSRQQSHVRIGEIGQAALVKVLTNV